MEVSDILTYVLLGGIAFVIFFAAKKFLKILFDIKVLNATESVLTQSVANDDAVTHFSSAKDKDEAFEIGQDLLWAAGKELYEAIVTGQPILLKAAKVINIVFVMTAVEETSKIIHIKQARIQNDESEEIVGDTRED